MYDTRTPLREAFRHRPMGMVGKPKRIANNTAEWMDEYGNRYIRLHRTDIISFLADGTVRLTTNGWQTVTTKERMNKHLQTWSIYQRDYVWYIRDLLNGSEEEYFDGMILPRL
jgi:hypothetical protein